MNKVNILHIVWRPDIGGLEGFVLSLSKEQKEKYNVTVCFLGKDSYLAEEFKRVGIDIKIIGMFNGLDVFSAVRLILFLKASRFDVIHVHCHNFLLNLCLKFAKKTPKIITEHGGESLVGRLWKTKLIYKLFISNYKKIIANSQYTKKALIDKIRINPDKILVVHCGIDIKKFGILLNIQKKKYELGIKANFKVVGIIGRLVKQKGIHFFISMAKEVLQYEPEVDFLIIGDGPLKKSLLEMSEYLGVDKRIKFLGFRRDIPELLYIIDVFAFTSEYEPLGIVLVEAMASGIPIVGFNVGGIPEVVVHNETGILVSEKDHILLAKTTIHLLRNEGLRKKMGQNGQCRARLYFDIRAVARETEQIYKKYLH